MRILAFLVLSATLAAGAAAGPAEDALETELVARAAGNVVQKEGAPPLAMAAWGDLFEAKGSPEATARAFVEKYGPLLGFPAGGLPGEMATLDSAATGPGHTLALAPAKSGVPFVGAAVTFGFDRAGKLVSVSGRYHSAASAQMGRMDAGAAVKSALTIARKTVPEGYLTTDGTLHEYLAEGEGGVIRHVYDVTVGVGAHGEPRHVVLGPDGEALADEDGGLYFEAHGKVFEYSDDADPQSTVDGNLPGLQDGLRIFDAYKLWGKHVYAHDAVAASDDDRFDYEPYHRYDVPVFGEKVHTSASFLEVNVYHHLMASHDRAVEWGVTDVDDRDPMPFEVWLQPKWTKNERLPNGGTWDGTVNNATFAPWKFEFARSNPAFGERKPAIDPSVICHEYGHFVHTVLNPKWKAATGDRLKEALAVGEGFGDTFSCAVTGKSHVQRVWIGVAGDGRERSIDDHDLDYCKIQPLYNGPKSGKPPEATEIHDAGKLFSGICSELKTVFGPSEYMPRILMALRWTNPASFRGFAYAVMSQDLMFYGGQHRQQIQDLFTKRKVWSGQCY